MCYSATANSVGGSIVGGVGILTLLRVRELKEVPLASFPLLFALHQLIEGVVWLGLYGELSDSVQHGATAAYVLSWSA